MGAGAIWVKRLMMVAPENEPGSELPAIRTQYNSSAAFKFTNSSLGGSFAINAPYQFTHWADIRVPPRGCPESAWREGQGRYYSEAFDDTRQEVHMSFGVPRFNSMTHFFTNFFNSRAALLANTGRIDTSAYITGYAAGFLLSLPFQPFIYACTMIDKIAQFLTNMGGSKWYYFKETMHNYWMAVNNIANILAINLGIAPRVNEGDTSKISDDDPSATKNKPNATESAAILHRLYPELFVESGGVDVYSFARAAQRKEDRLKYLMTQAREQASTKSELEENTFTVLNQPANDPWKGKTADHLFTEAAGASDYSTNSNQGADNTTNNVFQDILSNADFIKSSLHDGSQFVTFRVNNKPTFTETFSNSTAQAGIASTINGAVSTARAARFSLMDGNVSELLANIKNGLASMATGALDSVGLGGLAALGGAAFVDVPDTWENSTASLPRAEYTIPLYSPYGNKISRFIDMYIPIACLLAGALPLSAGRAAYTSPFICQIYHQGRVQCKLGMIDSLTITRGTGNVGFNAENEMLGAELSFSVVDLSKIAAVPIKAGFFGDALKNATGAMVDKVGNSMGVQGAGAIATGKAFDEESVFQDYLAVLGGLPVSDSYYRLRRLNLNMSYANAEFRDWSNPNSWLSWAMDGGTARMLSAFCNSTDRFNR